MKKLLVILFMIISLSGCSTNDNVKTVCKGDLNNSLDGSTQEQVITYKDNKAVKFFSKTLSPYNDKGVLERTFKAWKDDYESISGVSLNYFFENNIATLEITIDFKKADLVKLKERGLIYETNIDGKNVNADSLIKNAESSGLKCK